MFVFLALVIYKKNIMKKLYSFLATVAVSTVFFAQTTVLTEDFAAITAGNNTSTSGSSSSWSGNANFPTVSAAYQAGGAVRLGTGSASGSLTSKSIDLSTDGGNVIVTFDVKGWSTVEGDIKVTITGQIAKTVTYTAVLAGSFETKSVTFTGGVAGSTVKIETTAKRAFIDNVKVETITSVPLAIGESLKSKNISLKNTMVDNTLSFQTKGNATVRVYNTNGQLVKSATISAQNANVDVASLPKGNYVVTAELNGEKVSQKVIKK